MCVEIVRIDLKKDLQEIEIVVEKGFSDTPDAKLSDWYSFSEMTSSIVKGAGMCLKCV